MCFFFGTSLGEVIVLVDCDKAFDWFTTSRDVNAEFKWIGLFPCGSLICGHRYKKVNLYIKYIKHSV